jgi:O-antigen/teichoic acid export membrane protein
MVVSRARAGRDIAAQIVMRGANAVLGVAVTLVLVRALGDEGFGKWSTLFAVLMFVGTFGSLGLDRVAVERAAADPDRSGSWVGALVSLRLVLTIPMTLVAMAVGLWLADDAAMRVAAVLIAGVLPSAALNATRVVFQLQVRNALVVAMETANGVLWGLAVIIVAASGGRLVALAAAFLIVTTISNLAQVVVALRAAPVRLRGSRRHWRELLRLGIPVGIGGLLIIGYGYVDQVIVFQAAGPRDAGLYGAAYRIYERLLFIPATVMTTLFPIFVAARRADAERVRRIFHIAIDYLVMSSLPALAIALAGAEPLVRLLFGAEFAGSAPALPILMATFAVVSPAYLAGYLVVAYGLQRRFVRIALAALVFNVVANLLTVPRWGFIAAAWNTLATELIVGVSITTLICREIGIRPTGRHVGRIVFASALTGALAWGLRQAGVPTVAWLIAAGVAYAALLLALRIVSLEEVRALRRSEPAAEREGFGPPADRAGL